MKAIDKYFKLIVIVLLVYIAAMLSIHVTDISKSVSSMNAESRHGHDNVVVYVSHQHNKALTYHQDDNCNFLEYQFRECLSESDAVKKGYKPCAACTGNNTVN